ncbi:MAG: histidinol-phosphate aminotransferase [Gaiellaceae bacterium]|jgi:histidinol-phosphate aminotransferase|nr:histidinol-phosphate aminotransferase [Gaiellaceae bacterium]
MSTRLHGDTLTRPGMLDFAVNVWPGERPAVLEHALTAALARSDAYPEERAARQAMAARHGRNADEVLLTNGACEAFWLLAHALRPALAVCVQPSFSEPEQALRAAGCEVRHVLREPAGWTFASAAVPDAADIVVVGNPNNPTGSLDRHEPIAALARPGRLLVVDESFMDFVPAEDASLARRGDLPGLVVVRSLTKLWGLAGIRAGYLLAPVALVEQLMAQRQPWSVNSLACAALVTCAADRATPARVAAEVAAARAELSAALAALPGIHVWPSQTNFLLLRVADGSRVVAALHERGIAVRPAGTFPGLDANHIRVAVRTPGDNAVLVDALEELLA